MGFENVLYEINDGILYLTLNRPEARNALTPGMWKDIQAAVEMARFDRQWIWRQGTRERCRYSGDP